MNAKGLDVFDKTLQTTNSWFGVLSRHVPRVQIAKMQHAMPENIRVAWMSAEEGVIPPPKQGELGRRRA